MNVRKADTNDASAICRICTYDLGVSRDNRRQGVGRALITCAENWAKEQGINIVRLNSGSSRKEAHEFYRAMGYDDEKMQIRFLKKLN